MELTTALIKNANNKYPCKYIIIKNLDHLSELSKDLTLIPMIMASSLSLELNKLGKISSVSNYSQYSTTVISDLPKQIAMKKLKPNF